MLALLLRSFAGAASLLKYLSLGLPLLLHLKTHEQLSFPKGEPTCSNEAKCKSEDSFQRPQDTVAERDKESMRSPMQS